MKFAPSITMAFLATAVLRTTTAFTITATTLRTTPSSHTSLHRSTRTFTHYMSTTSSTTTTPNTATTSDDKEQKRTRILSGVQPTGSLHLGNYLGAIKQWVTYQNENPHSENYFCVVDLHAITVPQDPATLSENTLASAALYLAAGIDPNRSRIFVQSHVTAHAELAWLLNCVTPMNWLERMIQFKDKAKKGGTDGVGVGLFTYPVLMAADIILYQATHVPVGEDQRQHLELSRDIVRRFNDLYCKGNQYKKRCKGAGIPSRPVFVEPNAMIVSEGGARVMSLTDGRSKMSKSDENDASRINVLDAPDLIRQKIKKCKTDQFRGLEWDNPERPEASNLLSIYAAVQPGRTKEDILEEVRDLSWGEFKPLLAEKVIEHLAPIQERYAALREDDEGLRAILKEGAEAASEVAERTLLGAKVAMGFTTTTQS